MQVIEGICYAGLKADVADYNLVRSVKATKGKGQSLYNKVVLPTS